MLNDDTILNAAFAAAKSAAAAPGNASATAASPRLDFPGDAPPPDAAIVPVEGPANAQPARPEDPVSILESAAYGANNEYLPERLQNALRRVVTDFTNESEIARRTEIRRIKKAHQFWRGLQYLWWSERDQNWHLPFEQKNTDQSSIEDLPRYEFVTNIYQAFGLSIIAVLSQDVPAVRFFPQSAQAEEDVSAAKAATEVSQLVERNNRIGNLIVDQAFQLWTSGKVGAYVRYVVDGQRFGFHPESEIVARQIKIDPDVWRCTACGIDTSVDHFDKNRASVVVPQSESPASTQAFPSPHSANGGGAPESFSSPPLSASSSPSNSASPNSIPGACPACGELYELGDFVPSDVVTVPAAQTRLRVPNGRK